MSIEPAVLKKAEAWLAKPVSAEDQALIRQLIAENPKELTESFYTDLDFGTGGLRGVMGLGTNRINRYTLGMATQGLANYLKKNFDGKISVAIAFDSRNNSLSFSREVAQILSANDIHVILFEELRPTPQLSFAIRYYQAQAGIVITASHNPKEYNGYKVYWNDGGQLIPPHDNGVISEVRKVQLQDIRFDAKPELIQLVKEEIDQAYLGVLHGLSISDHGRDQLRLVFTSLHGTSITMLPKALSNAGFTDIHIIEDQATPDGNFPTVESPNPEEASALAKAVEKAIQIEADLVIGCDPDSDRVGIAVKNNLGKIELLNGNQTAAVLVDYILQQLKAKGKLPSNGMIAETIVTSDLLEEIGHAYGVEVKKCLTGFKWIAELIRLNEGKLQFLVGGEESYGYLIGDQVRDKDAIASGLLLAEAAAFYKSIGSSFYNRLLEIYVEHGFYLESLVSITKKGREGVAAIQHMMNELRINTPENLGGLKVVQIFDYKSQETKNLLTREIETIHLPSSNVIQLITEEGDKITARPSGTEPKIKFYFSVKTKLKSKDEFDRARTVLNDKIQMFKADLNL